MLKWCGSSAAATFSSQLRYFQPGIAGGTAGAGLDSHRCAIFAYTLKLH